MSTRTTTRLSGLAAAMLVFLAIAPAAGAKPIGPVGPFPTAAHTVTVVAVSGGPNVPVVPDRADKIGVNSVAVSGPQLPPDRADKIGVTDTTIVQPPDRVDQLGSANGPQPVQVATLAAASSGSSFDWTDALIGAGFGIALALLAAGAVATTRNRRGGVATS